MSLLTDIRRAMRAHEQRTGKPPTEIVMTEAQYRAVERDAEGAIYRGSPLAGGPPHIFGMRVVFRDGALEVPRPFPEA